MYVFVLLGRRSPTDPPYVVNIYGSRLAATVQRWRWLRRHPGGSADVQRFTVFDEGGTVEEPE